MRSDDGTTAVASPRDDAAEPVAALLAAAVRRYAPAGRFAAGFARGKLRYDPVFVALLHRGLIPDGVRLLDLGCGQGVLLALLVAAREQYHAGRWPADWPAPPVRFSLHGIECRPGAVRRARLALGPEADIEEADLRIARLAPCDVIALLDVVHYLDEGAQDRLLTATADALTHGGLLLMRVGDLAAGLPTLLTKVVDQLVTLWRSGRFHRFHLRTIPQWVTALEQLGFEVSAESQSSGTPFANVLLVARKRR